MMRPAILLVLLLSIPHGSVSAQSQQRRTPAQQKPDPDRLGFTCAQILDMTSTEWISKITSIDDSTADGNLRGIRVYGDCYDQRTDRLAAALAKSGKGPLMGARGNFRDFEQALQNFSKKALAESEPPADGVKSAYAALYEKQFRYAFYQSYDQQPVASSSSVPAKSGSQIGASTPPAAPPTPASAPAPTETAAPKVVDPFTLAKNHFGELLSNLPEDKMHDLHAAFGDVLVRNAVGASMQLGIYRYAIFLLEPLPPSPLGSASPAAGRGKSAQPFAPPPF